MTEAPGRLRVQMQLRPHCCMWHVTLVPCWSFGTLLGPCTQTRRGAVYTGSNQQSPGRIQHPLGGNNVQLLSGVQIKVTAVSQSLPPWSGY